MPRNEIVGIDINDDWKSIVRQLTHSPHGRIVLYRDSLDDAISMLRVREAYRLMTEKKGIVQRIAVEHDAAMRGVGQLADDRFPVIIDVDADNLIARHHDVVNADLLHDGEERVHKRDHAAGGR